MPKLEPDVTDPMELVGVRLPTGDDEGVREMAVVFVEEFLRMRFDPKRILDLFRKPFYAGAHQAWRLLGDDEIRRLIEARAPLYQRRT